jgi:hypothetical protein
LFREKQQLDWLATKVLSDLSLMVPKSNELSFGGEIFRQRRRNT